MPREAYEKSSNPEQHTGSPQSYQTITDWLHETGDQRNCDLRRADRKYNAFLSFLRSPSGSCTEQEAVNLSED